MSRSPHPRFSSHGAFTLIEMLVTLSLLVVLMVVAISWVTSITKRQQRDVREQGWSSAAFLVLDQIDRDLAAIDMLHEAGQSRDPRVQIEDIQLLVRTIDQGSPSVVRYVFDSESGTLFRLLGASQTDQSTMLGSIERFEINIELPDASHRLPTLRVTLVSSSDQHIERFFLLMREDVQR